MILPTMKEVAMKLKIKYNKAIHSKVISSSNEQKAAVVDLANNKKIHPEKLIYFTNSPNYCKANSTYDIVGTAGRECTMNTNHISSCNNLCCGHGEEEYKVKISKPCMCKFIWCCEVRCKTCYETIARHRCKSKN